MMDTSIYFLVKPRDSNTSPVTCDSPTLAKSNKKRQVREGEYRETLVRKRRQAIGRNYTETRLRRQFSGRRGGRDAEYDRFHFVSPAENAFTRLRALTAEASVNAYRRSGDGLYHRLDIMQSVIIVDKWHPLLGGVYGNLKH